jgi:hypothetical protein
VIIVLNNQRLILVQIPCKFRLWVWLKLSEYLFSHLGWSTVKILLIWKFSISTFFYFWWFVPLYLTRSFHIIILFGNFIIRLKFTELSHNFLFDFKFFLNFSTHIKLWRVLNLFYIFFFLLKILLEALLVWMLVLLLWVNYTI